MGYMPSTILEQLCGLGRQDFEPHVIDQQEVALQIACQASLQLGRGLFGLQFPHQIEDGTVDDLEARLDVEVADCLGQVTFAQAGWAEQEDISALADELAAGQFIELGPFDPRVKRPVELFERALIAEARRVLALFKEALLADVELVLKDQFQELVVGELMGARFFQT